MFAFDQALLPQLTTRKALILVDFQNDFLDENGALPSTSSDGFVNRALQLVHGFRGKGDVIWVQSLFERQVLASTEAIVVSDSPAARRHKTGQGRARGTSSPLPADPDEAPDQEAFLSHTEPSCVKAGSWGAKMSPAVEAAVKEGDSIVTKTQYSGFNGTHLLRILRAKMVMEVFICGSMANVGVYATALDAAGHGMSITVVEDCCGYREEQRQLMAVKSLIKLTGCEIASAEEVKETLQIDPTALTAPQSPQHQGRHSALTSSGPNTRVVEDDSGVKSVDIVASMAGLQLGAGKPAPSGPGSGAVSSDAARADLHGAKPKQQEAAEQGLETKAKEAQRIEPQVPHVVKHEDATADEDDGLCSITSAANDTTTPHSQVPIADVVMGIGPDQENRKTSESEAKGSLAKTLRKGLCEGDTDVIENLLPESIFKTAFDDLRSEVQWQRMLHQGGEVPRLVAVQGAVADDGSMPVYRHPSDESPPLRPFSPTVLAIKAETERHLGHALNHVLIQFYRDGKDYISEHSDKTLDIVKGSYIANVSLGAERTMVFRTKRQSKHASGSDTSPSDERKRQTERAPLPHNSLCRMGLRTNMKWLHSIRQDKRAERDKTTAELAFSGSRISLTFRQIGTFLDRDEKIIWGQGGTAKTRDAAKLVINGQGPEAVEMLKAFGTENNTSTFDWDARYGKGFDVLHIRSSPRFFASADAITNMRVGLMLAEYGVNYAKGSLASRADDDDDNATAAVASGSLPVRFVDNDENKSVVDGDMAILLYLDAVYGESTALCAAPGTIAIRLSRFQRALRLADLWRHQPARDQLSKPLREELAVWNDFVPGPSFADDSLSPTIVDFAAWPVFHALAVKFGADDVFRGLGPLREYYDFMAGRETTKRVTGAQAGSAQV